MHLIKFHYECGRDGDLRGVFLASPNGMRKLNALIESGDDVYFGEVLGKHSDVYGPIDPGDIEAKEISETAANEILEAFGVVVDPDTGCATLNGYNPMDYLDGEALSALGVSDEP